MRKLDLKPRGFELPSLTSAHFNFVNGLYAEGVVTEEEAIDLFANGIREMPAEVRRVLLPIDKRIFKIISDYLEHGNRRIAIYQDASGKKCVAATKEAREKVETKGPDYHRINKGPSIDCYSHKTRKGSCLLSPASIFYLDFLRGLRKGGRLTEDQNVELVADMFEEMPPDVRSVAFPFDKQLVRNIYGHLEKGERRIAIYRDGEKRHIVCEI